MKNKLSFVVIEDVDLQRQALVDILNSRLDLQFLAAFDNAEDAFSFLTHSEEVSPDLIFLDIEMPETNGFSLLDAIKRFQLHSRIILTTAFSEYAIKGYDYDITAYLLKPIESSHLNRAIDKAVRELNAMKNTTTLSDAGIPEMTKEHLMIKVKSRWIKLDYEEILYCEGANVNVKVITTEEQYLTRERLKNMEKQLPDLHFLRIHDSFIINLHHLRGYASNFTFVEMTNQEGASTELNIGPSYRELVQQRLLALFAE